MSCDLPAELKVTGLWMEDRGITGIGPDAFEGLAWLRFLSLDDNSIATIEPGAYEGSPHLWIIELSLNHIATIEPGSFRGLRSLATLVLRDNPLVSLAAGALELGGSDDGLRILFFDDCGRLREIEAGALPGTLEHVWLPGAALNYSQIAPRLPGDATCLDGAYCDVEHITLIGTGICQKGDYDTAECAWDGGDC